MLRSIESCKLPEVIFYKKYDARERRKENLCIIEGQNIWRQLYGKVILNKNILLTGVEDSKIYTKHPIFGETKNIYLLNNHPLFNLKIITTREVAPTTSGIFICLGPSISLFEENFEIEDLITRDQNRKE